LDGRLFFTAVIRDLTETKALEEQVVKSERLAALGKLVAEITHEIRNPLMMIGGFANQLLNEAPDEKSRKKLTIIAGEVSRLDTLLNDLRDFYIRRAGAGERMDLNEVLAEAVSLVDDACGSRRVSVDFRREDRPVPITGDRGRLKQVFLNLLKNSLEAMEDGGHLSIRVGSAGEHAAVVIADDGHGIPEANLEKVFSPFFTTKRKGTGLGLSVSKSIVEDSRGTMRLKSKEGEGTTIEVRFPLSNNE
jgi:signal transduction histidine kinase